ncbi:hypothetical protein BST96_19360 [Oceanicoccus sagamiensis]|uniref:Solute-binding protein family 3/N-terminal domain-containing protein n=2 Tax=Oceanicoccus sagamiensis TaxID=716816 RepID=A0A1X9NGA4_9GAMM|nr:hypothetical protein BST96_19360 [Oceanicoccus sagamiensis]
MVPVAAANLFAIWSGKINRELSKQSCYKFDFHSAANFKQFIDKAHNKTFDMVAVPAHLASYLINKEGYQPMAFLVWESRYLYITKTNSSLLTLQQFDGITLALPDPLTETSILAKAELEAINQSAQYQHYQNYNQVLHALMESSVDAAVMISPFYNGYKARPHFNNSTQVIHSAAFPSHGMLLATENIGKQQREELFNTLASLESGSGFLWESFAPISSLQLETLHKNQAPSVATLEQLLSTQ